eukprot:NODE_308_length_10101_cov_0.990102.p2 type:complete len:584 gc:universal NODE_308_length_10101_cov_0.990102:3593-5344(+)
METVKVIVRVRPFSVKEKSEGHSDIIGSNEVEASISITDPKLNNARQFIFDSVFGSESNQMQVYSSARPVIMSVLDGYNGTIFAYGQTGTGKSFTMEGDRNKADLRGIIPNAFEHIYSEIQKKTGVTCLLRVSYLEIYNEEIRDLLTNAGHLEIKEHPSKGIYVKDLSSVVVKNPEDMFKVMEEGSKNRSVGATLMNDRSSRSHSIFQIIIEMEDNGKFRIGKLSLVDLAGSERQEKTKATGDRLKEATKINLSLTTLGIVIKHLVDGKSTHVPYRDSKLTRLLQDSLGGNSKTLMIATLSPASYNFEESMSTLRYASRAKMIKNKPKVNEDPKDTLLRQFEDELKQLKSQLNEMDGPPIVENSGSKDPSKKKKIIDDIERKKKELCDQIEDLQNQLVKSDNVEIDAKELERLELSKKEELIEEERRKERELKKQIQANSDKKLAMQTNFTSLEEECQVLVKKLKQSYHEVKNLKLVFNDLKDECTREIQDLTIELENLQRDNSACDKICYDLFDPKDISFLKDTYSDFLIEDEKPDEELQFEYPTYESLIGIGPNIKTRTVEESKPEIPIAKGLIKFRRLYA